MIPPSTSPTPTRSSDHVAIDQPVGWGQLVSLVAQVVQPVLREVPAAGGGPLETVEQCPPRTVEQPLMAYGDRRGAEPLQPTHREEPAGCAAAGRRLRQSEGGESDATGAGLGRRPADGAVGGAVQGGEARPRGGLERDGGEQRSQVRVAERADGVLGPRQRGEPAGQPPRRCGQAAGVGLRARPGGEAVGCWHGGVRGGGRR